MAGTASSPIPLRLLVRLGGSALLVASAAVHLDLYLTGYRTIPTIGWLFLLQVAGALCLAAVVAALDSRLAAAAAALFSLGILGGYLLSSWVGLFGFREVRTKAGIAAGVLEVAAVVLLLLVALMPLGERPAARVQGGRMGNTARAEVVAATSLAAAGLLVAALLVASAAPGAGISGSLAKQGRTVIETRRIDGTTVLTDQRGFTLYWFALDTPRVSRCYASCATLWPPLIGRPVAGTGVIGRFGTIARSGGVEQATYDGHPLYTYAGDSAPGVANGNRLDLNGGYWYEMTESKRGG